MNRFSPSHLEDEKEREGLLPVRGLNIPKADSRSGEDEENEKEKEKEGLLPVRGLNTMILKADSRSAASPAMPTW